MSFTGKLADLIINFSLQGVEVFQKGLDQAQAGLKKVADGAEKAGAVVQAAFGKASLVLGGLVTAGVAASAWGQQFGFYMERLSRVVAGLFGPEIQKVLGWLRQLTNTLASLSDAQRTQIAHFVEGAAAALAMAIVLPKVFAGVQLLVGGIGELVAGMLALDVETGGLLPLLGMLVTGFAALAVGTEVGRNGLGGLWKAVQPLVEAFGKLATEAMKAIGPIIDVGLQLFQGFADAVAAVMPAIVSAVQTVGAALGAAFKELQPLVGIIIQVFKDWMSTVKDLLPIIADAAAMIVKALVPVVKAAVAGWSIFQQVLNATVRVVAAVAQGLEPLWKALGEVADAFNDVINALMPVINDLMKEFAELIKELVPYITVLVKAIMNEAVVALKALAFVLRQVADAIAFITGKKWETSVDVKTPTVAEPGRGEAPKKVGGQEKFEALWDRLTMSSRNMGPSPQEKSNDWLEKIFGKQSETVDAVKGVKPDIRK